MRLYHRNVSHNYYLVCLSIDTKKKNSKENCKRGVSQSVVMNMPTQIFPLVSKQWCVAAIVKLCANEIKTRKHIQQQQQKGRENRTTKKKISNGEKSQGILQFNIFRTAGSYYDGLLLSKTMTISHSYRKQNIFR